MFDNSDDIYICSYANIYTSQESKQKGKFKHKKYNKHF